VLERIGRPVFSLLSVTAEGGVADIEPRTAQPVDGRVTVAGRLTGPGTRLHLRYGFPGGGGELVRTHDVRATSKGSTGLAARRWAGRRVAALSLAPERHGAELVELGRRFSIVTPGTSLLVLETIDQHVEHRVRPPETLPDLRHEYDERMANTRHERSRTRDEKLAAVVEMWTQHVAWWKRQFTYPPRFRYDGTDAVAAGLPGGVVGGVAGGVASGVSGGTAAPPSAAPPPPPQREAAVGSLAESVEVRAPVAMLQTSMGSLAETVAVETMATNTGPTIALAPWTPETPYLKVLAAARGAAAYAAYLIERRQYGTAPGFFLDCADLFARRGDRRLALRILSNVAELRVEDARLLRVLAHRLEQLEDLDRAIGIFERVRRLRPEEPQSHRDLALALDRRASRNLTTAGAVPANAVADGRRALALLADVVMGQWDDRFEGIERLALEEANRMAALLERRHLPADWPLDPRLRQLIDLDLRIGLTWDTDLTDMDLWVTEPSGERCDYDHDETTIGGAMSQDFTQGYGPEVYNIRRAMRGNYRVQANFYGSDAETLTGPTTVQAIVVTNYGRSGERRRAMTLRLTEAEDEVDIGTVAFAPIPGHQPR
jgi:Ca-activated chloride channel family protein